MPNIVVIQAAINVFLDFYILVIPLQQVLKLQLAMRKKLGVAALFGIGFSWVDVKDSCDGSLQYLRACVVNTVRLAFTIMHIHEPDQFWSAVLTSELSIVEINVVIIAPCLLFLPAFISTSEKGLSSLRSRILSRSRLVESKESSVHDENGHGNGSTVKVQE